MSDHLRARVAADMGVFAELGTRRNGRGSLHAYNVSLDWSLPCSGYRPSTSRP